MIKYFYNIQLAENKIRIVSDFPIAQTKKNCKFFTECDASEAEEEIPAYRVTCEDFKIPEQAVVCGNNGDKNLYRDRNVYYRELIRMMNGSNIRAVSVYSSEFMGCAGNIYVDERIRDGLQGELNIIDYLPLEQMLLWQKSLILHSSFVLHHGVAILFTGPSGIGKSSQADLWRKYLQAQIINGDRAIIKWHAEKDRYFAYGSPYSGSSPYCENKSAPLVAIILLEQAEKNQIEPVSSAEAYMKLFSQVTINQTDRTSVENALEMVEQWVRKIPIYRLKCRLDKEAVELVRKVIE
ncbi:MAG: hypothetical protein E7269_05075 [Lachnospiraceae bacterium]|nr:hypothetical protein [Lachnospiraceae bacterium]